MGLSHLRLFVSESLHSNPHALTLLTDPVMMKCYGLSTSKKAKTPVIRVGGPRHHPECRVGIAHHYSPQTTSSVSDTDTAQAIG